MSIVRLSESDAVRYVALRAYMLRCDPWAFGAAPGDDGMGSVEQVTTYLADRSTKAIFGAVMDGRLIASCGVARSGRVKRPHSGWIWGVFCRPAVRGQGFGRGVLQACIEQARLWDGLELLNLSVCSRTPEAVALYESLGFRRWGTEPDAVRINGESGDDVYMQLVLD